MRAVVLGPDGRALPLRRSPRPPPPGELVTVLACGLCGSDMEKIGVWPEGAVLGHEVVARTADGRRVALIHHAGCGSAAAACAGHESTCERFPEPTIVPGGFAERVRAAGWVELPEVGRRRARDVRGAARLRAAGVERVPRGRVLVVGNGFIGRLFGAVLERRGDTVFAVDRDPLRAGRAAGRARRRRRRVRAGRSRSRARGGRAGRDGAALRGREGDARRQRFTGAS